MEVPLELDEGIPQEAATAQSKGETPGMGVEELKSLLGISVRHKAASSAKSGKTTASRQGTPKLAKLRKEGVGSRPMTAGPFLKRREAGEQRQQESLANKDRATAAFLRTPSPHKQLLVKEKTTELYSQLVLKERKIRQLEQQIKDMRSQFGVSQIKPINQRTNTTLIKRSQTTRDAAIQLNGLLDKLNSAERKMESTEVREELSRVVRVTSKAIKRLQVEKHALEEGKRSLGQISKNARTATRRSERIYEENKRLKKHLAELEIKLQSIGQGGISQARKLEGLVIRNGRYDNFIASLNDILRDKEKPGTRRCRPGVCGEEDSESSLKIRIQRLLSEWKHEEKALLHLTPSTMPSQDFVFRKFVHTESDDDESCSHDSGSSGSHDREFEEERSKKEATEEPPRPRQRRSTVMGTRLLLGGDTMQNRTSITSAASLANRLRVEALENDDTDSLPERLDVYSASNFEKIIKSVECEDLTTGTVQQEEESQSERPKRMLEQMRGLLETMKYLYLSDQDATQKTSSSGQRSAQGFTEELVMDLVARHGARCCGAQQVRLFVFDQDENTLWTKSWASRLVYNLKEPHDVSHSHHATLETLSEKQVLAHCFRSQEPVHIEPSVVQTKVVKQNVLALPVFGTVASGTETHRGVVGVLLASDKTARQQNSKSFTSCSFTEFDEAVLSILTDHIGGILRNICLERKRRIRERLDTTLRKVPSEVHMVFGEEASPLQFALRVESVCRTLLSGNQARIFLVDLKTNATPAKMWAVSRDRERKELKRTFYDISPAASIAATCILNGELLVINDVYQHGSFNANIDLRSEIYRGGSLVCVPILLPVECGSFAASLANGRGSGSLQALWGNRTQDYTLGCVQVSFSSATRSSVGLPDRSALTEGGKAALDLLRVLAPQVDMMWQFLFATQSH